MIERSQHLRFPLEARQPRGVTGESGGQHLNRHVAVQLGISGPIHLAHAAGADRRHNLIRSKSCSQRQRHLKSKIEKALECGSLLPLSALSRIAASGSLLPPLSFPTKQEMAFLDPEPRA